MPDAGSRSAQPRAGWLRRQVDEIRDDPALRVYGALLALVNVLTFIYWRFDAATAALLSRNNPPICWPFFERCGDLRVLDAGGVTAVLWVYGGLAVASVALFASRRLAATAYGALIAVTLVAALIWVQDYRLRLNQHYMAFFVTLAFLFLPNKRRLLQYLVVFFYFWAGTLKLSPEWLSGAALYDRPLGVPEALVPAACVYVVLLEMGLVWGLLARRAWIFWPVLAQFVLFHITSFTVVGFFYPTLMFAILGIFPLARRFARDEPPSVARLLWRGEGWSTRLFLAFFSLLQVMPWLFPGDTALTGEGRLFALHMFDARVVCEASATVHDASGRARVVPIKLDKLTVRIHCDPIVYLGVARYLCAQSRAKLPGFVDLDLLLRSRRTTDPTLHVVVDEHNVCASELSYSLWRSNPWIRKR